MRAATTTDRGGRRGGRRIWIIAISAVLSASGCAEVATRYNAAAAARDRLEIPAIGLSRDIVRGGQAVIDAGHVTLFDDGPGGWADPIAPGATGTYWLAAHRTSAGGTFRDLPAVPDGAIVRVHNGGRVYVYRITGRQVVQPTGAWAAVYGRDPQARRIVLQTSMPQNTRMLLSGVLERVE